MKTEKERARRGRESERRGWVERETQRDKERQ